MRKTPRMSLLPRPDYVNDAKLFIIAVEGQKTEKQYFSLFESKRIRVEVLPAGPEGHSAPQHVLERLVKFEAQFDLGEEDERWLIWDVDRNRVEALENYTQIARESGYRLGISNPCFELWLRLHFAEVDPSDTDCQRLKARLKQELGSYNWSNLDLSLYTAENVTRAIARAKTLEGERDTRWPSFPGTHVYKVVEKLLRFSTP